MRAERMGTEEHVRFLRKHRGFKYHVDVEALWVEQGGLCGLCGEPMLPAGNSLDAVAVDHDRACCPTNKFSCGQCVRDLIHKRCNVLLGHAKDNPVTLRRAVGYIERWSGRKRGVMKWRKKDVGVRAPQIRAENAKLFRQQSHDWFSAILLDRTLDQFVAEDVGTLQ
ncbi:MAG TPA: endonuclease domain-containing protein [Gemmatimonadaceae bacterium]|jgi:hypothetical protein|nr:endonuclease domain-containing protein [Gemmatimonadaceae bacterium]